MDHSHGYLSTTIGLLEKIEQEQYKNILAAATLMKDAIAQDQLIHVFGGGGHTTLPVGEMFFRAGGLCNINPIMETALSVFNQALKYLEMERCENFGRAIVKYYDIKPDDVFIIFHNIGVNACTIDAALEAKERGAKLIGISSTLWQEGIAPDFNLRHSSHLNLFDLCDVCIDDYNPVGDTIVTLADFDTPIAPVSNLTDFYIAHRLEIETAQLCLNEGIKPPMWKSANIPGGDAFNKAYIEKYKSRIKML